MSLRGKFGCARLSSAFFVLLAVVILGGCAPVLGQSLVRGRIPNEINPNAMTALKGTVSPRARTAFDAGRVQPSVPLAGMTIYFKPSTAQQTALDDLVKEQQTPGSPAYHKWITPAEYGNRFGLSTSDLEQVKGWLERQGFSIDRVAKSRNAITFSGTAGQAESAFRTEIHQYTIHGATHIANASAISIPSAFAGVVLSVGNISDFRPHPLHQVRREAAGPQYTFHSGASHYHLLAPGDFATIYDLNPLYGGGYTGSGQTIVVVGQSAIATSDIANFQSAAGLAAKPPVLTLVPNTGTSAVNDANRDEDESDLDVEWSGAIAPGATINFVYVGNNQNSSVFDAMIYAIDNNLGSVISTSYGACEAAFPSQEVQTLQNWFEQANAQGQTIVAAAGDDGATDCESSTTSDQATHGLAVDLPASSPYVTAIGGTEFAADVSDPKSYWNSSNGAGEVSATRYIPEEVWNDTSPALGIEAGGGGASTLFGKPTWQSGAGVPKDGARDVPDISLNASPNHDGYLYCASGLGSGSCSNGFLNERGSPNVAGGTSFGAPIFSGILAILAQKLGAGRLGNVNPQIYRLAASSYSSAFHDTTSGDNKTPCAAGSTDCSSSPIGYSAGTGYDLATGWGSIDAANFVGLFPSASTRATTTVLSTSNAAPVVNSAVTLTATVTSNGGSTTPAGSVQFVVDGKNAGGPVALSNGLATYSYTPTTAGSHTIVANYLPSDPSISAASSGSIVLTVSAVAGEPVEITATDVTVQQGSSGVSTVTMANLPAGFSGSVALSITAPSALTNACFAYTNPTASTAGSVTIYTSKGACASIGSGRAGMLGKASGGAGGGAKAGALAGGISGGALAALFVFSLPGFRRRRWAGFGAIVLLAILSFGVSGCGSSPATSPGSKAAAGSLAPLGTYTLTLTGTESNLNVSATTTFTLTVN